MKKIIVLITAFVITVVCFAQKNPKKNIRDIRKEFIEKRLELTEEEKHKFWPVADEYLFKERELRMNFGLKMEFMPERLTDKEAEEYFKMISKFHQDEYELFRTYSEKLKNIIGVNKTVMFYALRQKFKKEMIKRAGGRTPGPPHETR